MLKPIQYTLLIMKLIQYLNIHFEMQFHVIKIDFEGLKSYFKMILVILK